MEKVDGGPAFPSLQKISQFDDDRGKYIAHHLPVGGMSLRDWFAGLVLQGFYAGRVSGANMNLDIDLIVERSYEAADAMLKYRERR